jgi:hypothetical protein
MGRGCERHRTLVRWPNCASDKRMQYRDSDDDTRGLSELARAAAGSASALAGRATGPLLTGTAEALAPLLPHPLTLARPTAERVMNADAPVSLVDPKSRLLTWPNEIGAADWSHWVAERTEAMPNKCDPRFPRVVEVHDPDQPENRNAILIARVGEGVIVYTTLTLDTQIAGGAPGGLRLLVNLLSAGLTAVP